MRIMTGSSRDAAFLNEKPEIHCRWGPDFIMALVSRDDGVVKDPDARMMYHW